MVFWAAKAARTSAREEHPLGLDLKPDGCLKQTGEKATMANGAGGGHGGPGRDRLAWNPSFWGLGGYCVLTGNSNG
jgi:hypothetical protein